MPADPSSPHQGGSRPGDGLVRAGAVLFVLGTVATVVTLVPFLFDLTRLPTAFYLLSLLAPLGFGVALAGLLRSARARRRPARR